MAQFRYSSESNHFVPSIAEVMSRRGDIEAQRAQQVANAQARATEARGNAWGGAVQSVGQILGAGVQQYAQQRQETQVQQQGQAQDQLFMKLMSRDQPPDPREILQIYGPERGMKIAQGLHAFAELHSGDVKDARDTAGRLAIGLKSLSPQMQSKLWPDVRTAAIKGGLAGPEAIPDQPMPEFLDAIIAWSSGKEPAKAEPVKTREIRTKNPDGSETIRVIEDAPGFEAQSAAPVKEPEKPAAPTPTSLALEAAKGDPVKALRILRDQNASQARPDYQWVTRNGQALEIPKGTARAGDVPFSPPKSTSETAQDRQRKGRLDSARGFLERLNELRTNINTKVGPQAGLMGMARQGAAAIGLDPDVAEYERIRAAGGRALAVAIMGAQNLSDADAAAWANMLPGATIDAVTAKRLTDQIGKMLEETDDAPSGPVTIKTKTTDIPDQDWSTVNGIRIRVKR